MLRDNEDAYVSVNGETCWSKTNLLGTIGTQECGGGCFKEESFRVTGCYVALEENQPLMVCVLSCSTLPTGLCLSETRMRAKYKQPYDVQSELMCIHFDLILMDSLAIL